MAKKPWITLTIDQELLEAIDKERREQAVKQGKDISRSAYMCRLIEKALKNQ